MEKMTDNEEDANDNAGGADKGGAKAHRDRVRPAVIEAAKIRRSRQPDERDHDAAGQLVLPGDDQQDDQHERGDIVQQKGEDLLPEAGSLLKDIEREQAEEGNEQNAEDPRRPPDGGHP